MNNDVATRVANTSDRLSALYHEADKAIKVRGNQLTFEEVPDRKQVNTDLSTGVIRLVNHASLSDFEHDAAHELCHAIAGTMGFSLKVELDDQFRTEVEKRMLTTATECELAILDLNNLLGSFLTHPTVHYLLNCVGFKDKDWDVYMIETVKSMEKRRACTTNRMANIGFAIQYAELQKLGLPGLDTAEFVKALCNVFDNFEKDLSTIRSSIKMDDLLTPDGCRASTRALSDAFCDLLGQSRDLFTIETAWSPTIDWSLKKVCERLSTGI